MYSSVIRALVVAIGCAFLATGCAMTAAAPDQSGPSPLTAVAAFGDFNTIDYCSLLDLPKVAAGHRIGAEPDSSFESCRAEVTDGAVRRAVTVGPLAFDADPNLRPYDYVGAVPDGVDVQQSMFNDQIECTRTVTFADGIRLNLTVADIAGASTAAVRCQEADSAVGGLFGALTGNRVGRLEFAERSWGRVAPCALLDVHDLDASSGPETRPTAGLSGHSCIRGKVSLRLSSGRAADSGAQEPLAGRQVRVTISGAFCTVDTTQPASGEPGRAEKAEISVVETAGTAGAGTCAAARAAASSILPRLPQPEKP